MSDDQQNITMMPPFEKFIRKYGKGEVIFEENGTDNEMYIVYSGSVDIFKNTDDKCLFVTKVEAGDYTTTSYDSGTDATNKTSITVPASQLEGNTNNYWRVRHQDNHGDWSSWSTETWFLTINTAPNKPTNTAPANATAGISLTPTLTSSAFADTDASDTHNASQWQITTTAGDYSSPVYDSELDATNKTSIAVPASTLTTNTTYYWRARHRDNGWDWSAWSTETSFTTLNTAPDQPTNTAPSDEAIDVTLTPTLTSSAFADDDTGDTHAVSQWYITDTSGDYSSPAYDSSTDTTNKTSIAIPASTLSYSTTYYFRVRHQDNHSEWSSWSAETSFTTTSEPTTSEPNTAPSQPTNAAPENEATDVSVIPTLESSAFADSDTGDTHTASQWQITSTAGDYSSPAYDSGTDTSNKTSITVPAITLEESTTYYWRVRHQDNHSEWSAWSAETSFTTISIGSGCGCSSAAASMADVASGWGIVGLLGMSGVYTGWRRKKRK